MFVEPPGLLVFGIYKEAYAARRIENLQKFLHSRFEEDFAQTLAVEISGQGQTSQSNSAGIAWELSALFRRQPFSLDLKLKPEPPLD